MYPSPIKTPQEMTLEMAGIPRMQAGGATNAQLKDLQTTNPVQFFRHNPKNKYGAKDRLETQSSAIDKQAMHDFVKAMRAGEKYGVPQLPPEFLSAMILKEGRSDFGYDKYNENNPKAKMIADMLMKEGHDPSAAGFGAALYDKMQTSMRLKIPFATAWNGTGVNKYGQTGQQYANSLSQGFEAVMHPRNEPLLSTVREAYNYQPPQPTEQPPQNYIPQDPMGNPVPQFSNGGSTKPFYDMSRLLIQKHLSGN